MMFLQQQDCLIYNIFHGSKPRWTNLPSITGLCNAKKCTEMDICTQTSGLVLGCLIADSQRDYTENLLPPLLLRPLWDKGG